jgi:hypothetical protein
MGLMDYEAKANLGLEIVAIVYNPPGTEPADSRTVVETATAGPG